MTPIRGVIPALLLSAALPGAGLAEMTEAERLDFRAEVRAYLLENPEILSEMVAIIESRQQAETADRDRTRVEANAAAIFDDGFSYVGGDPEGDVTIVEFLDYQCGFCKRAHPEVKALVRADGGIRYVVKELPVLGPGSELAARAAIATLIAHGPDVYAALHDRLMRLQGPLNAVAIDGALRAAGADVAAVRAGMDDAEVDRRIAATVELAGALGVQGTPTFVVGSEMVRGYVPAAALESLVGALRAAE